MDSACAVQLGSRAHLLPCTCGHLTSPTQPFLPDPPGLPCPTLQRLRVENEEQQELIHSLLSRVGRLEESIAKQHESKPKGRFGGFFGPTAL